MLRVVAIFVWICFLGCKREDNQINKPVGQNSPTWLINETDVVNPGAGKDGIPALLNPELIKASAANYLNPNDLVVGYKFENETRAYPHRILDYHEIVNDEIESHKYAITYCPLTGTATNWSRNINGSTTTFGVSGLLYNSNLIPYDRATESLWSQMRLECVNGSLIGINVDIFQTLETTWKTWQKMYPGTKVLSENTGYNRHYDIYPYTNGNQDYREIDLIVFPIDTTDTRLHSKERVLGISHNGQSRVYRFDLFTDGTRVIGDVIGGEKVVVVGSKEENFIVLFFIEDQMLKPLESLADGLMIDQDKNVYDPFGFVISGPKQESQLKTANSYIGYWFAWSTFHPGIEIFGE